MNLQQKTKRMEGFTAIEMLVTIIVATIFTVSLYQLFTAANTANAAVRQRAIASELAYSYLRRYSTSDGKPTWFSCDTATGSSNTNDFTVNQNAAGQQLINGTLTNVSGLPGTVTYSVKALAVYGCDGTKAGSPIKVEASITYGRQNTTIKQATMVGY